jgi:hypothetical protein
LEFAKHALVTAREAEAIPATQRPLRLIAARQAGMVESWLPATKERGDSVTIVWASGFDGITLRLQQRGDSLVGIAHLFTDVANGPPDPTAVARARRVPCARGAR